MQQNIGIRISAEGAAQTSAEIDRAAQSLGRLGGAAQSIDRTLGTLRGAFAGLAAGLSVREFFQAADGMAQVNARLRLATTSAQEFAAAQADVYRIAQANNTALADTATLYSRLADPVRRLGGSARDTAAITEAVATSLRIVGASSAESSSAILQFSQALAAGALRGEEFNSVNEAAPRLMQALADGLGRNRGELRAMAEAGQLTADVVGKALIGQLGRLQAEAATLPQTIGGAFQQLRNDATLLAASLDQITGSSAGIASIVGGVAGVLGEFGRAAQLVAKDTKTMAGEFSAAEGVVLALGTSMEALVVLGANVAFTFDRIVQQIVATQRVRELLMQGKFDEGMELRERFNRESETARARLDAFTERVIGSTARIIAQRDALRQGTLSLSEYNAEMSKLLRQQGVQGANLQAPPATGGVSNRATRRTGPTEAEIFAERSLRAIAAYEKAEADLEAQLRRSAQAERELAAARDLRDVAKYEEAEAAIDRSLKSAADMVQAIEDETRALTQTNTEREVAIALRELERTGLERGSYAYEQYAAKIRAAVVNRETVRESVEQTREIEAQWQRTTDNIERALTDALMNGGKSAWEYIKGLFRSEVLRPIIQAVVRPVAGTVSGIVSSFLGLPSSAGASTGSGAGFGGYNWGGGGTIGVGGLPGMGGAGNMPGSNWFTDFGGSVSNGVNRIGQQLASSREWADFGTSLMDASDTIGKVAGTLGEVASYYQAFKAAEDGKWGQAIGQAVGTAIGGPLGGMIGNTIGSWLDKVFSGGAGTPHRGSIVRTMADGTQSLARDADWAGILNNYDQGTDQGLRTLAGIATGGFNRFASAFGAQGTAQSVISFAADGRDASIGNFQLSADGRSLVNLGGADFARYGSDGAQAFQAFGLDVLKQTRAALDTLDLSQWARDELKKFDESIATLGEGNLERATDLFNNTVEGIARLQAGMVELQRFMEPLGGVFLRVSDLSGDAMKELVDFAGGLENLANQTQSYVQNFFRREEIAGLQAREVRDTLLGAGLTEDQLRGLDTREEFRALVESIDPTTEAGRKQLAALLGVSGTFAGLSDYFGTDGGDLLSAAGQAPNTGPLTPPGAAPGAQSAESPAVSVLTSINAGIDQVVTTLRELLELNRSTPRVAITAPGGTEVNVNWNP
jgi:tape measure domain-containing protein